MTGQAEEIKLSRVIQAPASRVYEAFTTAAGWCSWCCETAMVDARVEGALHIYTEGYNAYGEFTDLEDGRGVAFTWDGDEEPPTMIRVLLDGADDGTRVTFAVTGEGWESEIPGFGEFLERTWGRALDNLKVVLEGGQ